jgi:hypothetical protein
LRDKAVEVPEPPPGSRQTNGEPPQGTPNRATRAVKEFSSEILDRADVQDAIRERILSGDTSAFFKAIEIVHGKPRQALEVNQDVDSKVVISSKD